MDCLIRYRASLPSAFHMDGTESPSYPHLCNIQNKLDGDTSPLSELSRSWAKSRGKNEKWHSICRARTHHVPCQPSSWLCSNTQFAHNHLPIICGKGRAVRGVGEGGSYTDVSITPGHPEGLGHIDLL